MTDFDKAMRDPRHTYDKPKNVLKDDTVDRQQKIKILKQWEYDARELLVAEEENMPGDESSMLQRVMKALHELGVESDPENMPPTKHGGTSEEE